jgi:ABC-type Fe3+/spermidine/putrescine transport system ATPase subunit
MLEIEGLFKQFVPGKPVLHGLSLTVQQGEIVCLLGPSGCGKTTLLRLVAGLERPDAGRIRFTGVDVTDVPVHRRRFGLMFQEYALFPHLTVAQNVAFGLRMAGRPAPAVRARVAEMLELVELPDYGERAISALSGGEQQRVALARTLAPQPDLVMLDEPLGSLDRMLRDELLEELRQILKRVGVTSLVVTHDQKEGFALGDRLVLMREGRIAQMGTPQQLYAAPADLFVARFLGFTNLLPAAPTAVPGQFQTALGVFFVRNPQAPVTHDAFVLIRPEAATLHAVDGHGPGTGQWLARVEQLTYRGRSFRVRLMPLIGEGALPLHFDLAFSAAITTPQVGAIVAVTLDPAQIVLVPGG